MKSQVKVSQTQPYKDGQVNTIVCQGTLKIFPCGDGEGIHAIRAIIFSETEKIEKGDFALDYNLNIQEVAIAEKEHLYFKDGSKQHRKYCTKIIAHERNFSPKQLQAIVDNKLKSGDDVLVKCHEPLYERDALEGKFTQQYIHFNGNNHIKLFPVPIINPLSIGETKYSKYHINMAIREAIMYPEKFMTGIVHDDKKSLAWIEEELKFISK